MRPEWSALAGNIAAIPAWLESPQPDAAIINHFGMGVHCGGMMRLEVAVCGWNGGPGGERGAPDTCRVHVECERHHPDEPKPDPLTEEELDEISALLEAAGLVIVDRWRADSWASWGCTYSNINPSVKEARRRYSAGCPEHGTVFCNGWQNGEHNKGCTAVSDGVARALPPAWVAVPWDFPLPAPSSSDGVERNLEVVRAAVLTARERLADLGIAPVTVTAGRRGDIVGEPGDLSFDEGTGLGVNLPAEAMLQLVELASLAWELGIGVERSS